MPDPEDLLLKEDKVRIKRCLYALQRDGLPPITTHNVIDDWSDPILNAIRRCQLFNTTNDRVKVSKTREFTAFRKILRFCLEQKFPSEFI